MKIGISTPTHKGCNASSFSFADHQAMTEYDLLIIDINSYVDNCIQKGTISSYQNAPVISYASYQTLEKTLYRRSKDLAHYIAGGRIAVFQAFNLPTFYYRTEDGYDRVVNNCPDVWNHIGIFPNDMKSTGTQVDINGSNIVCKSLKKLIPYFVYRTLVKLPQRAVPVVLAKGTEKLVGFQLTNDNNGHLFILPEMSLDAGSQQDATSADKINALLELVLELAQAAQPRELEFTIPSWASNLATVHQLKLRAEASGLVDEKKVIEEKLQENLALEDKKERQKRLFFEQGQSLLDACADAFKSLGFEVFPGPENRDDLICKHGDVVIVIEVKGRLRASAAEKDAAQLEKWVARYFEEHDVKAKGLLVVNGFCETPLDDRAQENFPSQMLPYCEARGHCLLSGIQLYCLIINAIDKSETEKADVRDLLTSTVGVFSEFKTKEEWWKILSTVTKVSS
jgi:hypothetical protein